jgi:hypothetical protein
MKQPFHLAIAGLLACAVFFAVCASAAPASSKYWIGGTAGNFNDNTRWSTVSGGANNTTAPGA